MLVFITIEFTPVAIVATSISMSEKSARKIDLQRLGEKIKMFEMPVQLHNKTCIGWRSAGGTGKCLLVLDKKTVTVLASGARPIRYRFFCCLWNSNDTLKEYISPTSYVFHLWDR